MDKKLILKKIKGVLGYKKDGEFADFLGISKQTLSSWYQRNTFDIELLYAKCVLINPDFLFTGCGPLLKQNVQDFRINSNLQGVQYIENECKDTQNKSYLQKNINLFPDVRKMISSNNGIPLISTSAMAGVFAGETVVLDYECDRYIIPAFKDAEFLISIKGSSMIPKYNSGDIVACKRMPVDTFFQWNKVYVLDTEQGALIKRIKKGTNDDVLTICSDNPNYEPFELHRSKIYNIAMVVGVIRLE